LRLATVFVFTGFSGSAGADEGGVSFWVPGQYGSFAAIAPTPGFSLPMVSYFYSGDAGGSRILQRGNSLDLGLDGRFVGQFIVPSYAPDTTILGGKPNFSMAFLPAWTTASAGVVLGPLSAARSQTTSGFSDLYPTAQLFWNSGVHNWMAYATGDIPVGSYSPDALANIGIGHGAVDFGGAYTYLDPKSGWEFSGTAGLTFNFENPSTKYTNGVDSHLDWGVAKFVNQQLFIGAVGFVYQQLTPDRGQPEILGDFQSSTIGVGPQIGYNFDAGGTPITVSLRGYFEAETKNRLRGESVFLTLNLPISALAQTR
jgi:hypothetical protein